MVGFTVITIPPLIAGLLEGVNRRSLPDFQPDKWAPYKLMSLTSGIHFAQILAKETIISKSTPQQVILASLVGPPFIAGMMYCMGIQMTKIPSKDLM
jgi:hypothetical protein